MTSAENSIEISLAVFQLIENKLLLRQTHGEDRRRSELKLSAKGYKIFDQIVPLALAYEQQILSALPVQEQNQLLAILDKLEAAELALKI